MHINARKFRLGSQPHYMCVCVCQCFGEESNCRGKAIFGVSCFSFSFQFEGGKRHVQNNNNTSYPPRSTGRVSCPNIHKCTHQYSSSARLPFNPLNPRGSSHYANVYLSRFIRVGCQTEIREGGDETPASSHA